MTGRSVTHSYTWRDVRDFRALDLAVGDVFVKPGCGTAYYVGRDGSIRGAGLIHAMSLDGTAWTVVAREGDLITCRAADGREVTERTPESAHVLRVHPGTQRGGE